MKKTLTILLALVAVAAIVVSCVFGVQKGDLQKSLNDKALELENAKADLNGQLDAAQTELQAAKADLEATRTDLEAQVNAAKADLEATQANLNTANADLETTRASLDTAKADLEAQATAAKAELESQSAAAQATLDSAKAELEAQLNAAKAELEAQKAALEGQKTQLEQQKAELENKVAQLEADLLKTQRALVAAGCNAYIMYANADWSKQNWGTADSEDGTVIVTPAKVTGEGDYTVGLEFQEASQGLAFTAVGIKNGEIDFPGYYIRINAIRVNGEAIEVKQGYTSSDDGKETRMNIYNEWVSALPTDARAYNGNIAEAAAVIVDKEAFAAVKTMEVDFSVLATPADNAYIMFANSDWSVQNWGIADAEGVKVTAAEVRGAGDYTVGLEFANPSAGVAFIALGIQHGEITFPNYFVTINQVRVNGEPIAVGKFYTSSDNKIETRVNLYNEWVSSIPEDAHRLDDDLADVTATPVAQEAFLSVSKIEVDFSYQPVSAYLMYANEDWSVSNFGYASTDAVKVISAPITGEGEYTVGLEFAQPAEGLAFAAVGVKNGEKLLPGYILKVTSVSVNDGDNLLKGVSYTSSDDGRETRSNIYNAWVSALPEDARAESGLENASPTVVDPAAFTGVKKVMVTFQVIKGKEAAKEAAPAGMTADEAAALKEKGFHAYIGVQGKDTYVFRNAWNDNYGLNDTEHPFFNRLTGWDDQNNAVDYGGTFADTEIKGDGQYTVSLTTGEMGFGATKSFNLVFVSTDIPSDMVKDGFLTISDVKVKIGSGATKEFTCVNTEEGKYARIDLINTYGETGEPFGYNVPGPNETIEITFTVSGW